MTLNQHDLTIISKYFASKNDYINLIKTCKNYKYILNNFRYNPIYFKSKNESFKLFPNIETYYNYFHIKYNGYVIANPYFLSLYAAFKEIIPCELEKLKDDLKFIDTNIIDMIDLKFDKNEINFEIENNTIDINDIFNNYEFVGDELKPINLKTENNEINTNSEIENK